MAEYHNWPYATMKYYSHLDRLIGPTYREYTAREWIDSNVTEYIIRRGFEGCIRLYIKDPKELILFQLKFGDLCL